MFTRLEQDFSYTKLSYSSIIKQPDRIFAVRPNLAIG